MTRIIGGALAGRRLAVPGSGARPTTDRVREAMFSSLDHRIPDWRDCRVLDLFAGSGALGLEAVSRGAAHATFVERDRAAVRTLRSNIAALAVAQRCTVVAADALRWRPPADAPFDLLLADPPYDVPATVIAGALARLDACGALSAGALAAVERPARDAADPLPTHWVRADRRRYGATTIWYGRAQDGAADLEDT